MIYTILESRRRDKCESLAYLNDVLLRLPGKLNHKVRTGRLIPSDWKPAAKNSTPAKFSSPDAYSIDAMLFLAFLALAMGFQAVPSLRVMESGG